MKWLLALVLALHGSIHLIGVAKAFEIARLPQLNVPISRLVGCVWLAVAVLCVTSAVLVLREHHSSWLFIACAAATSQTLMILSWHDAKFGTVPNALLAFAAVLLFAQWGPGSLRAKYEALARERLFRPAPSREVSQPDPAQVPDAVLRYLERTGLPQREALLNFHARFVGRIRSGPNAPWMACKAEQYDFFHPPERIFWMRAERQGVPFEALHHYVRGAASMIVKAAGLFTVARSRGPTLSEAETVTLLNDMCVFAPTALLGEEVQWQTGDPKIVAATYVHAGHTVHAQLSFNDAGDLISFASPDRSRASHDGKSFTRTRWVTPLYDYRRFGPVRLSSRAEAIWEPPEGRFTYAEFRLVDIRHNVHRLAGKATGSRDTLRTSDSP